jgi:hypothetical protein
MPRSRRRRRRPAHSAHGSVYWWLVMWPRSLERAIRRSRAARAHAPPRRRVPPPPPPPPLAGARAARRPWATHEGSVRPLWGERDSQAV